MDSTALGFAVFEYTVQTLLPEHCILVDDKKHVQGETVK